MSQKKKISYEQNEALAAGRNIARANQRRATAARREAEAMDRERAERLAREEADKRAARGDFDLGQTVTGLDRTWRKPRTGVVVEGPRSEYGQGVFVVDADGNEWCLSRYSVEAV